VYRFIWFRYESLFYSVEFHLLSLISHIFALLNGNFQEKSIVSIN
jgi:hypothetical protein